MGFQRKSISDSNSIKKNYITNSDKTIIYKARLID